MFVKPGGDSPPAFLGVFPLLIFLGVFPLLISCTFLGFLAPPGFLALLCFLYLSGYPCVSSVIGGLIR